MESTTNDLELYFDEESKKFVCSRTSQDTFDEIDFEKILNQMEQEVIQYEEYIIKRKREIETFKKYKYIADELLSERKENIQKTIQKQNEQPTNTKPRKV